MGCLDDQDGDDDVLVANDADKLNLHILLGSHDFSCLEEENGVSIESYVVVAPIHGLRRDFLSTPPSPKTSSKRNISLVLEISIISLASDDIFFDSTP